jgi:hypothetical protein
LTRLRSVLGKVEPATADRWLRQLSNREELPVISGWSAAYVGVRLIEAFRTLSRLPPDRGPKQFGTALPMPVRDFSDLVDEGKGDGNIAERTALKVKITPSAKEYAKMEQALYWVPRFLKHNAELGQVVNHWAMWRCFAKDIAKKVEVVYDGDIGRFDRLKYEGLTLIAMGLARSREMVG